MCTSESSADFVFIEDDYIVEIFVEEGEKQTNDKEIEDRVGPGKLTSMVTVTKKYLY